MLEQKNKNRARVRLAVFFVLSIHAIGLMALLMQGCRKPAEPGPTVSSDTNTYTPIFEPTNTAETNLNTYVPPAPETNVVVPVETAPAAQEYIVVKGDNFSTIAKKFPGVTVKQIQEANPAVQPTKLQIGQKLKIPAPAPVAPATSAAPAAVSNAAGEMVYSVKSGDTLTKIATAHHTTVKAIRSANNLTTDKIVVGQKLKIPAVSAPVESAPAAPVLSQPGQ
jgi:LysM repeat protein